MYGSSFWRETFSPRALRMVPMEAAVMPFPRLETTPPVTKTNFGNVRSFGVFRSLSTAPTGRNETPGATASGGLGPRLQEDHLGLVTRRTAVEHQLGLVLDLLNAHLGREMLGLVEGQLETRELVVHRDHDPGLELVGHRRRRGCREGGAAADRHQQHVDAAKLLLLSL